MLLHSIHVIKLEPSFNGRTKLCTLLLVLCHVLKFTTATNNIDRHVQQTQINKKLIHQNGLTHSHNISNNSICKKFLSRNEDSWWFTQHFHDHSKHQTGNPNCVSSIYTMTYLSAISYIAENNPTKKSFIWYRNNEKGNNRKLKQICWRKNM